MPRHVYLFSGASAVGKTSALKALLPLLEEGGTAPCVCKIDCLKTGDGALFQRMGLPCVTGLSGDDAAGQEGQQQPPVPQHSIRHPQQRRGPAHARLNFSGLGG